MKRIGLIDNLGASTAAFTTGFENATAAQVMEATGGNTGNVAFVHATRKILGDTITRVGWGTPVEVLNRDCDHLVICCANQLGEHIDLKGWADSLARFEKPVTLIGLGVQAPDMSAFPKLPEGTQSFLDLIKERNAGTRSNVGVRGEFTQSFLASVGMESEPLGCPSVHISPVHGLGRKILERQEAGPIKRVAVAAGNPWHQPSAPLERVLVDVVEKWCGDYLVQHPVAMLGYALGDRESISQKAQDRFLQIFGKRFDQEGLLSWFRRYACLFVDAPKWIHFLRKFDLVFGPRYHGVALAIQSGAPGRVITIDSRTTELCERTAVPSCSLASVAGMDADALLAHMRWHESEAIAFDETRAVNAQRYVSFLEDQGLAPSGHILNLASAP